MRQIVHPTHPDISALIPAFRRALETGRVTNGGENVLKFEDALSEYFGARAIATCNGQSALMIALAAAGVDGGEVICPSFTFVATPAAIRWAGATPVFADIDPKRWTLDPNLVSARITEKTKAVLAVDPYGICADYPSLERIGTNAGIPVIVDSAPALGSLYGGIPTGRHCTAQIFSFHATKPFSTMEGGCIVSRSEDFLDRCKAIRNFGQSPQGAVHPGINGKMMEISAIVGLENLKEWPARSARRRASGNAFRSALLNAENVSLPDTAHCSPIWGYMPIAVPSTARDALAHHLRSGGIGVREYYSPACHLMPAFRSVVHLPVTEMLAMSVIALPLRDKMQDEAIDHIVSAINSFWAEQKGR